MYAVKHDSHMHISLACALPSVVCLLLSVPKDFPCSALVFGDKMFAMIGITSTLLRVCLTRYLLCNDVLS